MNTNGQQDRSFRSPAGNGISREIPDSGGSPGRFPGHDPGPSEFVPGSIHWVWRRVSATRPMNWLRGLAVPLLLATSGALAATPGDAPPTLPSTPAPAPAPARGTATPAGDVPDEAGARDRIEIRSLNPDFKLTYDLSTGTASATNGVQAVFGDSTLTARRIRLDEASGDALAEGGVTLTRGAQVWVGSRIQYNFRTGDMKIEEYKFGSPPLFIGGDRVVTLEPQGTNRVMRLEGSYITTDDLEEPGYRIRARTITLREDRRVVARDATLYMGNTPVFWFPYYTRRMGPHATRWMITPGYRSQYGLYARALYEFDVTPDIRAGMQLDPFTERGIGLGPEIAYDLHEYGEGSFEAYWIADQKPGLDPITGAPIEDERHRVRFDHRVTLRPGLTATAVVREQSDSWIVRDFFEDEFRRNPFPSTHFEVQQAWPDFTLNALARVQVTDTWETVERLPDVKLSAHRQQLGGSPLYYEGESSVGWFRHEYATGASTNDYSAARADSFHQLLVPRTFFGFLNVTPRVGGRVTYYGETTGPVTPRLEEQTRAVFNTGAEVSFKAHRLWSGAENRFWDVDGLRHILEPSVNYAYTPRPDARPLELPQFDGEIPSLRLLPVQYPDYNSIDAIDSQNVLRMGVRNKLQTKRAGKVEDIVDWAVLTDWRIRPNAGQDDFNDVYSELDFKPRRWLTINSEVRVDPNLGTLDESQSSAIFQPTTDWSFAVTHRLTRDDALLGPGGNLLGTRVFLKFSENWGFRTSHFYEIREQKLREQYYTVYRDLRSLTAALTLRWRSSVAGRDEDFSVAIAISLKAYPRFRRNRDAELPELLIGG